MASTSARSLAMKVSVVLAKLLLKVGAIVERLSNRWLALKAEMKSQVDRQDLVTMAQRLSKTGLVPLSVKTYASDHSTAVNTLVKPNAILKSSTHLIVCGPRM